MKQKYKDWIIKNIRNGDLHTSTEWVEYFCDEFSLKKRLLGADCRNNTFNKTLKSLEEDGLIEYAYKVKVPSHWNRGGGMLTCYKFTEKGYINRDMLNDSQAKA